ncbi:MAG: hypothetical protein WAM58_18610 [Candidatus Acidiferrum sp.]
MRAAFVKCLLLNYCSQAFPWNVLFAPRNLTVAASLLASALSVSGAIFPTLQMYSPYGGLIHVSPLIFVRP